MLALNNMNSTYNLSSHLPAAEFDACFTNFSKSAFRLETFPEYRVGGADAELYNKFSQGEPWQGPIFEDWARLIASHTTAGREFVVARVLSEPLSNYLRFEIEWGYCYFSTVGQDTRIILPSRLDTLFLPSATFDYWMFDDNKVVFMEYGSDGSYKGARYVQNHDSITEFVTLKGRALAASISLREFLSLYRTGRIR